jgi:hypothetical protein
MTLDKSARIKTAMGEAHKPAKNWRRIRDQTDVIALHNEQHGMILRTTHKYTTAWLQIKLRTKKRKHVSELINERTKK